MIGQDDHPCPEVGQRDAGYQTGRAGSDHEDVGAHPSNRSIGIGSSYGRRSMSASAAATSRRGIG